MIYYVIASGAKQSRNYFGIAPRQVETADQ